MAYEDLLKDESVSVDGNNYFLITVTDLNISSVYPIQLRWKYEDGTFGEWSAVKTLVTPAESSPDTPRLTQNDVVGGPGYIKVTWAGVNGSGQVLTNYNRIDVYIDGTPFDGTKPAASFSSSGTQTIVAPQGEYLVALYAVSTAGTKSAVSSAFSAIVTGVGENIEAPTNPQGFSSRAILGGVEVSWDGTYSGNDSFTGFEAIKIYAGTSSTATSGTYTEVGVLTGNNVKNTIVVPVDDVYVKYGDPVYFHAAAVNKSGTVGTLQQNVTSQLTGAAQAGSGDIAVGAISVNKLSAGNINSTSYIRAGTAESARVEISSSTIGDVLAGLHIYNSQGDAILSAPLTGGLTISGGGTFTGNLSIGSGSSKFGSDSNGIWLGSDTYSISSPFRVSRSGYMVANSGTIGGWDLSSNHFQNSTGTFKVSSLDSAIYVGDSNSSHIKISASGGIVTYSAGTPSGKFNLSASGNLTISGDMVSSNLYIDGNANNATQYIKSDGSFNLGKGTIQYGGGTPSRNNPLVLNTGYVRFSGIEDSILENDNNAYGGDNYVVINQSGELTRGRALHYGGTTVPTSSNLGRYVWNSKDLEYDYVVFAPGDLWMTVD
jgi:hypothetical protein